jgi:cyclopropane fatty-acyl-phospholipid synthase-like methyltransferase
MESTLVRPSEQSEVYTEGRKRYWEDYARSASKWVRLRSYYQFRLAEIYKLFVPPGMRVLELGCGDYRQVIKGTNNFHFTCPGIT